MDLSQLYLPIGLAAGALGLGGGAIFFSYRRWQKSLQQQRLEDLTREVTKALDDRGARHPELIQDKLDAAEEKWRRGDYDGAEKSMEDLLNIVRLS